MFSEGRFEEALVCYQNVAEQEPFRAQATWSAALCLQNLGRWEQARKLYLAVLALDVDPLEAQVGLALCHLHRGRPHMACQTLRHCLKTKPESYMALFGTAVALQFTRRAEEAAAVYRKILELYPQSEEARANLRQMEIVRPTQSSVRTSVQDPNSRRGPARYAVASS